MHSETLIYISKATRPLTSEEVEQIAVSAAEKNHNADITGLLLQVGDHFIQVLEGRSMQLSSLLRKIEADNRHTDVRVIYKASDKSRMFGQWAMGYFNIENYYQVTRCDVERLRRFIEKAFANSETSKAAIVQVISTLPILMQGCEIDKSVCFIDVTSPTIGPTT